MNERVQDGIHYPIRGKLLRGGSEDARAVHRLGLAEGVEIGRQRPFIVLAGDALPSGREAVGRGSR